MANEKIVSFLKNKPEWHDDELMRGMMAMFKDRYVNPHEYDARMKFWQQLIYDCSEASKTSIVEYRTLLLSFRQNDRVPSGLETVMKQMIDDGDLVDVKAIASGSSWLSWGFDKIVYRPISWITSSLMGSSSTMSDGFQSNDSPIKRDKYILKAKLEQQASDLISRQRRSVTIADPNDPLNEPLVSYADLLSATKDIFADEKALEVVLSYLESKGQVTVNRDEHTGDKIIKFAEGLRSSSKLTEIDTNIMKLKRTLPKLDKEIQLLEQKKTNLENDARTSLRDGNKSKALKVMRLKKNVEKNIIAKEQVYNNIVGLLDNFEQTKDQKQVIDAYKSGVAALKQSMAEHGLSTKDIDETMDDIQEAMSDHDDISTALGQSPSDTLSQADLEDELNELLKDDNTPIKRPAVGTPIVRSEKEPRILDFIDLPDVPSHSPEKPAVTEFKTSKVKKLNISGGRDRLAELRHQLETS